MAIKSIEIMNVMIFKRHLRKDNGTYRVKELQNGNTLHDSFRLNFCDGINVLIGENGVGKTTILKMIYAAAQFSVERTTAGKTKNFLHYFSNNLKNQEALKNSERSNDYCGYKISDGRHCFEESLSHNGIVNYEDWLGLNIQSVFIPTMEMLSHSKGFLALNEKYNMPFDGTQLDIVVNASLPEARVIPSAMQGVLQKISNVIEGTVIQEDDCFYVQKSDGRKIEFSLEAEGLRKLGLLWKLIRNGLLENGTILLWDEPEANLNPELYALVAEILLELEKNGVQIFAATHNYNFAKYLEIRRERKEQVMYHNLYLGSIDEADRVMETNAWAEDSGRTVFGQSAYRLEDLRPNHLIIADSKLLDEVYAQ
ncbi:MAG: AAA family ATPase [Lachnospiraceae bacterium]|nr:AAA family ATPase [Lachnospiraceae bacterium]